MFKRGKIGKKGKFSLLALLLFVAGLALAFLIYGADIAILNPKGIIANQERDLIVTASLLSLIVVVPVFILTFFIAWRYREGNKKAKYSPDWDHNIAVEAIWWAVPLALILVLSVITWKSTHELDPLKPLESSNKPITIQVVALQWKWLFIYPAQNIATVNVIQFPQDTPIDFHITADAPMNSFWIPRLGGQIYAMSGMSTRLHIMADEIGTYTGSSANISGYGFSGMKFTVRSSSQADFDKWVEWVRQSPNALGADEYDKLAKPSENNPETYYRSAQNSLYNTIVRKFMDPTHEAESRSYDHSDPGSAQ